MPRKFVENAKEIAQRLLKHCPKFLKIAKHCLELATIAKNSSNGQNTLRLACALALLAVFRP
jgi:hypothetical protein